MSTLAIKKVNHNTIDVFHDTGWEAWGRFKIKFGKDANQLFQIKGNHLPKEELQELKKKYNAQ